MNIATADMKVSNAIQSIAEELNKKLERVAGQHMNFSLIVFNSKAGSRMSYISNAERDDVYQALASLLQGWDEGMPDIPAHKLNS